ncbi:hypothetical protein M885DRAFT_100490 [Pelagophyceae sp. CCMP2097]|nr:hypothetical protein M885DRAFT_100490 [Pelagophyceae sp. CCMP2097]
MPASLKRRRSSEAPKKRRETLEAGAASSLEQLLDGDDDEAASPASQGSARRPRRETISGDALTALEGAVGGESRTPRGERSPRGDDDTMTSPLGALGLGLLGGDNDDTVDEEDLARATQALAEARPADRVRKKNDRNDAAAAAVNCAVTAMGVANSALTLARRNRGNDAVTELLGTPPRRHQNTSPIRHSAAADDGEPHATRTGLERVSAATHVPSALKQRSAAAAAAANAAAAASPPVASPASPLLSPPRKSALRSCLSQSARKRPTASPNVTFSRSSFVAKFDHDDPPSALTPCARPAGYDVDSVERRANERLASEQDEAANGAGRQRTLANSATLAQWQIETHSSNRPAADSPRRSSGRFSLDEDTDSDEQVQQPLNVHLQADDRTYTMELTQALNLARDKLTPIDEEDRDSTGRLTASSSGQSSERRGDDYTVQLETDLDGLLQLPGFEQSPAVSTLRSTSAFSQVSALAHHSGGHSRASTASYGPYDGDFDGADMTVPLEADLSEMLNATEATPARPTRSDALTDALFAEVAREGGDAAWRLVPDDSDDEVGEEDDTDSDDATMDEASAPRRAPRHAAVALERRLAQVSAELARRAGDRFVDVSRLCRCRRRRTEATTPPRRN